MLVLLLVLFLTTAFSEPRIVVEDAWVREVPPVSRNTAVFMRIINTGDEEDELVGVTSPVAERAELHETREAGGVVRMRRVKSLTLGPGEYVELRPMGVHIMLISLKEHLKPGGGVELVLIFRKSGRIRVRAEVRGAD